MDYPGFGLSDGLHGYIPNFDQLVDDVVEQYAAVKGSTIFEDYFPSLVSVIDNLISCFFHIELHAENYLFAFIDEVILGT
jgi:hypothetical protein